MVLGLELGLCVGPRQKPPPLFRSRDVLQGAEVFARVRVRTHRINELIVRPRLDNPRGADHPEDGAVPVEFRPAALRNPLSGRGRRSRPAQNEGKSLGSDDVHLN